MTVRRGIPPVSDYAHWNEQAEEMWYLENKYDMMHPEVFEPDPDDYDYPYEVDDDSDSDSD
jgi:hypothetical protein